MLYFYFSWIRIFILAPFLSLVVRLPNTLASQEGQGFLACVGPSSDRCALIRWIGTNLTIVLGIQIEIFKLVEIKRWESSRSTFGLIVNFCSVQTSSDSKFSSQDLGLTSWLLVVQESEQWQKGVVSYCNYLTNFPLPNCVDLLHQIGPLFKLKCGSTFIKYFPFKILMTMIMKNAEDDLNDNNDD